MWYAAIVILILIVSFLMLRMRFRVELSDGRRVMFMGIGRSGVQIDLVSDVTRVKLCGITIRTTPRLKSAVTGEETKAIPIAPTRVTKKQRDGRKRASGRRRPYHVREWLDIGFKSLRALQRYVADLYHAVIVEEAEAEVRGGFESPDLTGQAYGYYQALVGAIPSLAPRLRFEPDWMGQSFSGNARLSLAIPMYALVYRTLLMIFRLPLLRIRRLVREQRKGAEYAK